MGKQIITAAFTCIVVILLAVMIKNGDYSQNPDRNITVGFVYIGDESTSYSYNFIKAQENAREKYGDKINIISKYNVDGENIEETLNELVMSECDLIFSTSYEYQDVCKRLAGKYPHVQFCQAAGDNANRDVILENYHNFAGTFYQGRYVSGVVSGMKLKEMLEQKKITLNQIKIGYIGSYPYAEVISGYTAFILGVRSVVPTATMTVTYTNTWSDFMQEKELAEQLIGDGCILIAQHCDTIGPAVACVESSQEVYHVGYSQSMIEIAPSSSLIGCRIVWDPYVDSAIEAVISNMKIEENIEGYVFKQDAWSGFENGWMDMLELNEAIAAEGSKEKVEDLVHEFIKGDVKVFYGDYIGVSIDDKNDKVDLHTEYIENETSSAATFHYILEDVIKLKKF